MPTDNIKELEGNIDEKQTYLISGGYLKKLLAQIKTNRPIAGTNITLAETEKGTIINGA